MLFSTDSSGLKRVDDDTFLNARRFYHDYLLRQIEDEERSSVPKRTVFGLPLTTIPHPFLAPAGMFATMSWEIVLLLARLQSEVRQTWLLSLSALAWACSRPRVAFLLCHRSATMLI